MRLLWFLGGISPFSEHKKTESAIKRVRLPVCLPTGVRTLFLLSLKLWVFVKIVGIR